MSPQKVSWLYMQGFTTKYDLGKAEVEILSEPLGLTLHTRKTGQLPLRHNSYQAVRKRIGEKGGLQRKEKI